MFSATQLLGYILEEASRREDLKKCVLHVLKSDEGALGFYEGLGFRVSGFIENFYQELNPSAALCMHCSLPWTLTNKLAFQTPEFDATKHNLQTLNPKPSQQALRV